MKNKIKLGSISLKTSVNFGRVEPPFRVRWLKIDNHSPISLSCLSHSSVKLRFATSAAKHDKPKSAQVQATKHTNTLAPRYNSRRNSSETSSSVILETTSRAKIPEPHCHFSHFTCYFKSMYIYNILLNI